MTSRSSSWSYCTAATWPHVFNRTAGRRLPIETAVSLIVEAATALQAAHTAQVIHRDLKPANLFRQNAGPLKICDFGVAHIADAVDGLTTAGHVIGTVSYMSPEQCQGETRIDGRSDLYSLGCVLYELLTGRPPFRDGNARQIMNQQITMSPLRPRRDLRRELSGPLETLVLSMLAKSPARRPVSASSLAAALEAVLGRGTPGTSRSARSGATAQAQPLPVADGERTITRRGESTRRASTVRKTAVWQPDPQPRWPTFRRLPIFNRSCRSRRRPTPGHWSRSIPRGNGLPPPMATAP